MFLVWHRWLKFIMNKGNRNKNLLGIKNVHFSFPRIHEHFICIKKFNSPSFSLVGKCPLLECHLVLPFYHLCCWRCFPFFSKYTLNSCCVPSTILNVWDTLENRLDKVPFLLWNLNFSEDILNKCNKWNKLYSLCMKYRKKWIIRTGQR